MKLPLPLRKTGKWFRRKTRSAALAIVTRLTKVATDDLRQFVYLDDVALRSLMAARYGAEEVRILETTGSGKEAEINAGAAQSLPTVANVNISGRYQTSSSRSSQVERQTTIQSIFKEFLARETEHGSLAWDSVNGAPARRLKRGDLIQVRVRLAPDPAYQVGAVFAEMSDLAKELKAPGIPPETAFVSKMLERLMIGQVPIRAAVDGYSSSAFDGLGAGGTLEPDVPLFVVGSTDVEQYWTDTRRVLYGNQVHTLLVRVTVDGPTDGWSPIKLFDMMKTMMPGGGKELEHFEAIVAQVGQGVSPPTPDTSGPLVAMLLAYAVELGIPREQPGLEVVLAVAVAATLPKLPNVAAVSAAFDSIDSWWAAAGNAVEKGDGAIIRRVTAMASLSVEGAAAVTPATGVKQPGKYIEGEVIAIYW